MLQFPGKWTYLNDCLNLKGIKIFYPMLQKGKQRQPSMCMFIFVCEYMYVYMYGFAIVNTIFLIYT